MVPCISDACLIIRSACSELIKSSVNHRKAWGKIWQHQEVGRKVLWECDTASAFISATWHYVSCL